MHANNVADHSARFMWQVVDDVRALEAHRNFCTGSAAEKHVGFLPSLYVLAKNNSIVLVTFHRSLLKIATPPVKGCAGPIKPAQCAPGGALRHAAQTQSLSLPYEIACGARCTGAAGSSTGRSLCAVCSILQKACPQLLFMASTHSCAKWYRHTRPACEQVANIANGPSPTTCAVFHLWRAARCQTDISAAI